MLEIIQYSLTPKGQLLADKITAVWDALHALPEFRYDLYMEELTTDEDLLSINSIYGILTMEKDPSMALQEEHRPEYLADLVTRGLLRKESKFVDDDGEVIPAEKLVKFSALPVIGNTGLCAQSVTGTHFRPTQATVVKLAEVLQDRGCKIHRIGQYAVSAESSEESFRHICADEGKGDLAILSRYFIPNGLLFYSDMNPDLAEEMNYRHDNN